MNTVTQNTATQTFTIGGTDNSRFAVRFMRVSPAESHAFHQRVVDWVKKSEATNHSLTVNVGFRDSEFGHFFANPELMLDQEDADEHAKSKQKLFVEFLDEICASRKIRHQIVSFEFDRAFKLFHTTLKFTPVQLGLFNELS